MAIEIPKEKPKWLSKIDRDHFKAKNRAFEGWLMFVKTRIMLDQTIDRINTKYKSCYSVDQLLNITSDQIQQAIDMLDLNVDDDEYNDDEDDE